MKRIWLLVIVAGLIIVAVILFINMGFLGRFFGNRHDSKPVATSAAPPYQEDWASYLTTIDNDKVGAILVDLGLKTIAPIKANDHRLRINVALNAPSLNGLPSGDEHRLLGSLSDQLVQDLKSKAAAVFAGHLFCDGTLSFYFYIDVNAEHGGAIAGVFDKYPNYKYEVQVDKETTWQTYLELLYPLPIQMQSIQNQKVVDNLKREGDKLEKKRPVDHMVYFMNEEDVDRFLNEIKENGFEVVSRERTDLDGYAWSVLLRRDDPVDAKSVDEYVLYLWQKAHDANGEYDGWGSTIVRE